MTNSDEDDDYNVAAQIVDHALCEAIDEAIEAQITSACFMLTVLQHVAAALVDDFGQSPSDVAALAQLTAEVYIGTHTAASLH